MDESKYWKLVDEYNLHKEKAINPFYIFSSNRHKDFLDKWDKGGEDSLFIFD